MEDTEDKLEYSPEELEEVDRILEILPEGDVTIPEVEVAESREVVESEDLVAPVEEITEISDAEIEGIEDVEDVEDITDLIEEVEEPTEEAALDDLISSVDEVEAVDEDLEIEGKQPRR